MLNIEMSIPIYSLGHSDRSLKRFFELLYDKKIKVLIDIRRVPNSSIYNDFSKNVLKNEFESKKIEYRWRGEEFGGYREEMMKERPINDAWNSSGLRAYADHAFSEEFQEGLEELLNISNEKKTAIMCAETDFKKCYRRILCDWLVAKEKEVIHVLEDEEIKHELTDFAVIHQGKVVYPKDE